MTSGPEVNFACMTAFHSCFKWICTMFSPSSFTNVCIKIKAYLRDSCVFWRNIVAWLKVSYLQCMMFIFCKTQPCFKSAKSQRILKTCLIF
jgi:hypothetical protein